MFGQNAYAAVSISLPQASTIASSVDNLHEFLWWLSLVSLTGTMIAVFYFVSKFHHTKKGRKTEMIRENHKLETLWTVIPLILMLAVFAWGFYDYRKMRDVPANAIEINVVGKQWLWNFEYSNGRKTLGELVLPKGQPVKLIMTSEDVLHGVFLPNMRIKQDVVPGLYSYLSFTPTLAGEHPVYCTEFCGAGHSDMLAKAYVVEPVEYQKWLVTGELSGLKKEPSAAGSGANAPVASLADQGKEYSNNKGCVACHSADGAQRVGPTWKGLFGTEVEHVDGSKATADENYLRESILKPNAHVVKGFAPGQMPAYEGVLKEDEINAIIAYIKSLK